MQYLSIGIIGVVLYLLIRAKLKQRQEIKEVPCANLDGFEFHYRSVTKFGEITSSENQAVFNVQGCECVLQTPFEKFGAWLAVFDPYNSPKKWRECTNFFFTQQALDVICPNGEPTSDVLLEYLEKQNYILK